MANVELMQRLNYKGYIAQGGDWGSDIFVDGNLR